jgi:hypothetical protein
MASTRLGPTRHANILNISPFFVVILFLLFLPQISFFNNSLKIEQEKGITAYAYSYVPQNFSFGLVGDYSCNDNTRNTVIRTLN